MYPFPHFITSANCSCWVRLGKEINPAGARKRSKANFKIRWNPLLRFRSMIRYDTMVMLNDVIKIYVFLVFFCTFVEFNAHLKKNMKNYNFYGSKMFIFRGISIFRNIYVENGNNNNVFLNFRLTFAESTSRLKFNIMKCTVITLLDSNKCIIIDICIIQITTC